PGFAMAQKGERPIEVAAADAEPHAVQVESDERRQHEVDTSRVDLLLERGLLDAEQVASEQCLRSHGCELHSLADDDRRVDTLAVTHGGLRDSGDRRLSVERVIDGERAGLTICPEAQDAAPEGPLAGRTPFRIERPPRAEQLLADARALAPCGRRMAPRRGGIGRGAPRLCRHERLLSNQSKRWGKP